MPRIRKITVGKGLTINLGDFSGVRPHIELEAELEDGESYEDARAFLMERIDGHLSEEIDKHSGDPED